MEMINVLNCLLSLRSGQSEVMFKILTCKMNPYVAGACSVL